MIPVSTFILFHFGWRVEWAFIMVIVWDIIGLLGRLIVLHIDMNFPIIGYAKKVVLPVILIIIIT